jgi:hypothetical protein
MKGLEPPYLTASDPKSDVSTNFTTSGCIVETGHALSLTRPLSLKWAANVGHFSIKIFGQQKKRGCLPKMLKFCFFNSKKV